MMKRTFQMICVTMALLTACTAMTACGGKKDKASSTVSSVASVDQTQDVDDEIDNCETLLESTDSLPVATRKSTLELLRESLEDLSKRADLTEEQTAQINKLLDQVNEKLKEEADIDLDDPDLKLSDIVG